MPVDGVLTTTLAQNGQQRVFQSIPLIRLPMTSLIHQDQRGGRSQSRLAVRRNGPDKVTAAVTVILDFKPGSASDREGRLLILGKRPDEAHHEVKGDARLIPRPSRNQDFAPGLPVPFTHDCAQGDTNR